jgi:hypothetical protein
VRVVVEVLLTAEEDDLVLEECLADLRDRGLRQVGTERDAVDAGTDSTAQLGDGEVLGAEFRLELECHGNPFRGYPKQV